jgi:signal transduction histidine kinase
VDGLLDFAKLGPPVSGRVSLREALKRASALVRPIYRERKHSLSADIPEASEWVVGNPLVIDQLFVNLLVNAAEASEAPVSVSVDASPASGEQTARNGSASPLVCISVRDTGPGIPEPLQSTIFQPFFTTRAQATGLGLTSAREAARDLGGDVILCESQSGAHFSVLLPAMSTAPTSFD